MEGSEAFAGDFPVLRLETNLSELHAAEADPATYTAPADGSVDRTFLDPPGHCRPHALYWAVVLVRVQRINATRPTVRRGLGRAAPRGGWPAVSVVIPAHNEERVIDRCVRSVLQQDYPQLEVIVVLDRCTDGTLDILQGLADADPRLTLLINETCPDDWAGKCNAARLGAQQADGDLLLFIDADTHAHPELLKAAVSVAIERELGLLSLLSTLTCEHAFERTAQPVASMTLMTLYPPDLVNRLPKGRPFANGQSMLFDRACYESIGGHDAVKDDLLEDIAFARCVARSDRRVNILNADGLFTCSMYSSLDSFGQVGCGFSSRPANASRRGCARCPDECCGPDRDAGGHAPLHRRWRRACCNQ